MVPNLPRKLFNIDYTVELDDEQEKLYRALVSTGFTDSHMLTLAGPKDGGGVGPEWFRSTFHEMCAAYYRQYDERPQWIMTCNRGWSGTGQWTAHVTWKNEVPRKLKFMLKWWNGRFGSWKCILSVHRGGLRYNVKNMGQPDARTYEGRFNRRNSPKRGKGFRGEADIEADEGDL